MNTRLEVLILVIVGGWLVCITMWGRSAFRGDLDRSGYWLIASYILCFALVGLTAARP